MWYICAPVQAKTIWWKEWANVLYIHLINSNKPFAPNVQQKLNIHTSSLTGDSIICIYICARNKMRLIDRQTDSCMRHMQTHVWEYIGSEKNHGGCFWGWQWYSFQCSEGDCTVNCKQCTETLKRFWEAIRKKRPEKENLQEFTFIMTKHDRIHLWQFDNKSVNWWLNWALAPTYHKPRYSTLWHLSVLSNIKQYLWIVIW